MTVTSIKQSGDSGVVGVRGENVVSFSKKYVRQDSCPTADRAEIEMIFNLAGAYSLKRQIIDDRP